MKEKDRDIFLLQRFAETGDPETFSEIVGRYQEFVYGACLRVLGNTADAEDVAQECFLRLLKQADTIKSSLAGWLHHRAIAMSIDEKRRQVARRKREEVHNHMAPTPNENPSWQEIAPHVDTALDELPAELRLVLIEHFLRRRTQAEIAEELGVSGATVSRRVDAGTKLLSEKLKKAGVIISGALLASLIVEHSACAVPAAFTAALGKMALAGKAGTAVAAAMTSAAKIKIIAVAVAAALAVGAVAAHKMRPQPEPAPVASGPADEQEAAKEPQQEVGSGERTLLSVMPREALWWLWTPNYEELVRGLQRIGVPVPDNLTVEMLTVLGMPEEALRKPVAILLLPEGLAEGISEGSMGTMLYTVLLSVDDVPAFLDSLGPADADGIHSGIPQNVVLADSLGDAGRLEDRLHWQPHRGFVAVSGKKTFLRALSATKDTAHVPSKQAAAILDGAQAFLHIDGRRLPEIIPGLGSQADHDVVEWLDFLADELESIDVALHFDEEDIVLKTLAKARGEGRVAKYLVPSEGLETLEPALPRTDDFLWAFWADVGDVHEMLIDDLEDITLSSLDPARVAPPLTLDLLAKGYKKIVDHHKGLYTGRFGAVGDKTGGLAALIAELAKPDEVREHVISSLKSFSELFDSFVPAEIQWRPKLAYDTEAGTIAGVKTDLLFMTYTGPDGSSIDPPFLSVRVATVGDRMVVAADDEDMAKALVVLQERDAAQTVNDVPAVKKLVARIGPGWNAVLVLWLTGFAPHAMPDDTYAAACVKVPEPGMLRCDVHVPSEGLSALIRAASSPEGLTTTNKKERDALLKVGTSYQFFLRFYDRQLEKQGVIESYDLAARDYAYMDLDALGLPRDTAPDEVFAKADKGHIYLNAKGRMVTLRGTQIAPLVLPGMKPKHPDWLYWGRLRRMTWGQVIEQLESYLKANPGREGQSLPAEFRRAYIVRTPDGELVCLSFRREQKTRSGFWVTLIYLQ